MSTPSPTSSGDAANESAIAVIRNRLSLHILTRSRVVFIGLGGIGLPLARAVVTFLAGLRPTLGQHEDIEVVLCDGDAYDEKNAYRMDIPDYTNKAEALGCDLLDHLEVPGLVIRWLPQHVDSQNVDQVITDGDFVLLACDNHATRHLVGRRSTSKEIEDIVLISGGNDGVEDGLRGTYGNVQLYVREHGRDLTAPIDSFHPEIAHPSDASPAEQDCIQLAAQGTPQISIVNLAVASAMCNAILRMIMPIENEHPYDEVTLDVLDAVCTPHWLSGTRTTDRN